MKINVKKSNAGRKPVLDKKIQVSLYIPTSQIEKFGDIEVLKKALYEFVALRSLTVQRVSNHVCPKCKSINNTGLTYDNKYCCLDCGNLWAND